MSAIRTTHDDHHRQPELRSGDRMTREEFHRIYSQMPQGFKAELIGGTVFVASPVSLRHGRNHLPLGSLLMMYEAATPGVECGDNTTIILADDSEPQPDLFLRILPEFGGRSKTTADEYLQGPPELVAEVTYSSRAIDLHAKREDYARNGVLEYLVLSLKENQLRWFDLRDNRELPMDADGVCRAGAFPGLWIDAAALCRRDHFAAVAVLQKGLDSPEHAEFIKRLASAKS